MNVNFRAYTGRLDTDDEVLYYHARTGMVLTREAQIALGLGSDCVLPVVPGTDDPIKDDFTGPDYDDSYELEIADAENDHGQAHQDDDEMSPIEEIANIRAYRDFIVSRGTCYDQIRDLDISIMRIIARN